MADVEETIDPLEQFLEDVNSVAQDIRESRAMPAIELQRSFAQDFFPLLHKLGEEVLERDADHEARIRRVEASLGLGEMDEEELASWLDEEPPQPVLTPAALAQTMVLAKTLADDVAGMEGASADAKERAALLGVVAMKTLEEASQAQEEPEEDEGEDEEEPKEVSTPEEPEETEGEDEGEEASEEDEEEPDGEEK